MFSIIDDDKKYNEEKNINLIKNDTQCDVEKIYLNKKKIFLKD